MKESDYSQLKEFEKLPLYDDDDPSCSSIDSPPKMDEDGTIWIAVHEATTLSDARDKLEEDVLVPKGGIRYWDGEHKSSSVFAYFWEKR